MTKCVKNISLTLSNYPFERKPSKRVRTFSEEEEFMKYGVAPHSNQVLHSHQITNSHEETNNSRNEFSNGLSEDEIAIIMNHKQLMKEHFSELKLL